MNAKTKFLFLVAATLGLASCHHKDDVGPVKPPTIETAPNKVLGYITDISGNSISGATITLNSETTTSNSAGYYEFVNIKPGSYIISVDASGMLGETNTLSVATSDVTQYYVWNASLYEDRSVEFNYTVQEGGEAETVTEAMKDNEMAEIEIDVNVDAEDVSENAQLFITPIYTDNSPLLSRAIDSGSHMLVGCILSSSNPNAVIINPINLSFNVGSENASAFKAMVYKNDEWVDADSDINGDAVVVSVKEFGGVGLFTDLTVSQSKSLNNLTFTQSYWDNTGGAYEMNIENATYEYMAGTEFDSKASNPLEALMMEYVARSIGAMHASSMTGTYPINVKLPMGYFLRITGTQEKNSINVKHQQSQVSVTNYGTCSFYVTASNKVHSGGGD